MNGFYIFLVIMGTIGLSLGYPLSLHIIWQIDGLGKTIKKRVIQLPRVLQFFVIRFRRMKTIKQESILYDDCGVLMESWVKIDSIKNDTNKNAVTFFAILWQFFEHIYFGVLVAFFVLAYPGSVFAILVIIMSIIYIPKFIILGVILVKWEKKCTYFLIKEMKIPKNLNQEEYPFTSRKKDIVNSDNSDNHIQDDE